jgi:predicted lipoprotein with Yx(FWY)xxD motif
MKQFTAFVAAAALAIPVATGCAWMNPSDDSDSDSEKAEDYGPLQTQSASIGTVLTDENGMTLYTFDKDEPGKSNCSGECAVNWPPAIAAADAEPTGDLTIVERDDGTKQWADEGQPLYTYIKDEKPGDVTGDGVNGVWHAVTEE